MDYKIDSELFRNYLESDSLDSSELPVFSQKSTERDLASRVKMAKSFDGLNVLTTSRAKDIEQIIALLIMRGSVNPDNLGGTIVDFGMGTGPGAYVLNQYGGNVTGVDSSESGVQRAIEEGILPKERALVQEGFEYLRSIQPDSLNLT